LSGSKTVEVSPDQKHMRTRDEPGKWSLAGVEPTAFSSLDASVPEFVPGQVFRVPPAQSGAPDTKQPPASDKEPVVMDSTSEVSSRLEEMSVSVVTAAEAAVSDGAACPPGEVHSSDDADALPDSKADFEDDEEAAFERLNTPSDDEQRGKGSCLLIKLLCSFRALTLQFRYLVVYGSFAGSGTRCTQNQISGASLTTAITLGLETRH